MGTAKLLALGIGTTRVGDGEGTEQRATDARRRRLY
jgi:hypothetical protein